MPWKLIFSDPKSPLLGEDGANFSLVDLKQRMLIANLWVILITIIVSASLALPFGDAGTIELLSGYTPYFLTNCFALYLAYQGHLRTSLITYTVQVFVVQGVSLIFLRSVPVHMILAMINFVLLNGVVLGNRAAMITTIMTIAVGLLASSLSTLFSHELSTFIQQSGIQTDLGWKVEAISFATTILSTGFLVITTLGFQALIQTRLSVAVDSLRQTQRKLEQRNHRSEQLAELGGILARTSTPDAIDVAVQGPLKEFLVSGNAEWRKAPPAPFETGIRFGLGPSGRWLICTTELGEMDLPFIKTVAELYENSQLRVQSGLAFAATSRLESVGRLAASVAHDFNNLLVPIQVANTLLEGETLVNKDLKRLVHSSRTATAQATAMIRKLLAYSGSTRLETDVVNLSQVLRKSRGLLRTFLTRDVTFELNLPEPDVFVKLSEMDAEQVILNLVLNARDAMDSNGLLTVSLTESGTEWVCLEVCDDGPGIPVSQHDWVLEPFHTTREGGTGLGLATVKRIVDEAEGKLTICTSPQGGACISILLKSIGIQDTEAFKVPPGVSPDASVMPHYKVLVADDEEMVAEGIGYLLTALGHSPVTVGSGKEALEMMQKDPGIDLLVTDYQMGDMTGLELIERFRATGEARPALILSGYGRSLELGDQNPSLAVLAKPVDLHQLDEALKELMGRVSDPFWSPDSLRFPV